MKSTIDTEQIKQQTDLVDLAGRFVILHRESRNEYSGPCPKCGGRDRFHCRPDWFFCRQCHPKRGDAIEFVQWVGLADGFKSACEVLGGATVARRERRRAQQPTASRKPGESWVRRAMRYVDEAADRLHSGDNPGADYLARRGLDCISWAYWGFGYDPAAGREKRPAVVIPWYAGGRLVAVRLRFLDPQGGRKIAALPGSRFAGWLYGGHVLPDFVRLPVEPGRLPAEAARALFIVEGELNAASIWQVGRSDRLDVLSLGSESQRIPSGLVELSRRYGRVFAWLDRPALALSAAIQLPTAVALYSQDGLDANDLLQRGVLGEHLATARLHACTDDDQRRALLWDLLDGGEAPETVKRIREALHEQI